MTIKKINVEKIESNVAKAIELGDGALLVKLRGDLIKLRQAAYGGPAASARPALYELVGKLTKAVSEASQKADDDRVDMLVARIDQQLDEAREVLINLGKAPQARLDAVRAHLRVAWAARCQLGGPEADPVLRDSLSRRCRNTDGTDGRAKFFSELEIEFKEIDEQCKLLADEAHRLRTVERAKVRRGPQGNPSLKVGRGVIKC